MPAPAIGLSAYIDVPAYLRATHGAETATLLGLNTTLSTAAVAGATSLVVTSSTGWAAGLAWILDGAFSEVVSITGSADGTHVTLAAPGLVFAHNAGASISQAGTAGSLAEAILRASYWIDGWCRQGADTAGGDRSLFAVARTERWAMPSTRAYIDRDNVLAVMPGHFPVSAVSALSVDLGQGQSVSLDVTALEIAAGSRVVEAPFLSLVAGSLNIGTQLALSRMGLSRSHRQWAVLSYTGGIGPSVPYDVQQAAIWLTSEILGQRGNPMGAAEIALGRMTRIHRQRGDVKADSILVIRAYEALQPYRAGPEVF